MSLFCPCGSTISYNICCFPLHQGQEKAASPAQLMRSRYAAYAKNEVDYLIATTHPRLRHLHGKEDIANWAASNEWVKLEIVDAYEAIVEFKAYFKHKGKDCLHHEISVFEQENGIWYYLSGTFPK